MPTDLVIHIIDVFIFKMLTLLHEINCTTVYIRNKLGKIRVDFDMPILIIIQSYIDFMIIFHAG